MSGETSQGSYEALDDGELALIEKLADERKDGLVLDLLAEHRQRGDKIEAMSLLLHRLLDLHAGSRVGLFLDDLAPLVFSDDEIAMLREAVEGTPK